MQDWIIHFISFLSVLCTKRNVDENGLFVLIVKYVPATTYPIGLQFHVYGHKVISHNSREKLAAFSGEQKHVYLCIFPHQSAAGKGFRTCALYYGLANWHFKRNYSETRCSNRSNALGFCFWAARHISLYPHLYINVLPWKFGRWFELSASDSIVEHPDYDWVVNLSRPIPCTCMMKESWLNRLKW